MPIHVRDAATWKQFPTTPPGTRLLWFRDQGVWKAPSYVWVRDAGVWKQEAEYVGKSTPATNLRITSASNDFSGISVAWDAPTSGAPPSRYQVVLEDSGGGWLQSPFVSAPTTTYRFGSVNQSTQYQVYVGVEETPGGAMLWTGPAKWYVGRAAYDIQDVPIYGWGQDWEWTPNAITWDPGNSEPSHPPTKAIDNSWDAATQSFWLSRANPYGSGQPRSYEGFEVQAPYWAKHRLTGVHLWTPNPITLWWSAWRGGWQGSIAGPTTDYGPLNHPWVSTSFSAVSEWNTQGSVAWVTDGSEGGGGVVVTAVSIMVGANLVYNSWGYSGFRGGIVEVRLCLQNWYVTGYGWRTVPQDNSRSW